VFVANGVESPLVPEEPLAALNGENPSGAWTFRVADDTAGNTGSLAYRLSVTTARCLPPDPPAPDPDGGATGAAGSTSPAPAPVTVGPIAALPDRTRPALSRLRARRGRISYRLSERAAVTFTLERSRPGRRRGRRCVAPSRAPRGRRCRRFVVRGTFTHAGRAGDNARSLPVRLRGRRLAAGRYRLRARARDAAGNRSPTKRARVTLRRR
jgi:hypothetical protein